MTDTRQTRHMQIGDLAAHIGTSPRALRHYEQEGLLAPARGHNGYRLYDATDVVRAANIKNLLDAGLTTADIGQYLDRGCLDRPLSSGPRCPSELDTAAARLSQVDELLERLHRTRERLEGHVNEIEESIRIG